MELLQSSTVWGATVPAGFQDCRPHSHLYLAETLLIIPYLTGAYPVRVGVCALKHFYEFAKLLISSNLSAAPVAAVAINSIYFEQPQPFWLCPVSNRLNVRCQIPPYEI